MQRSVNYELHVLFALTFSGLLVASAACGFSTKPSKIAEELIRKVEQGKIEEAMTSLSNGFISSQGIESVKQGLSQASRELKEHGGVKSITVLKEDVVGEVAEVTLEITRGNGLSAKARYKLIQERGTWKIDSITSDSAQAANQPLHPESAVADVVKWAHENSATQLENWLQKQSMPPICTAPAVDRNTLPDEVRYYDVDDPKAKERLHNALEPVLRLVGCANSQGVVLYKGQNVYAGNLDGGLIAITPGALYFAGSPPDEHIFHSLAELRIFLAREVFRQMIAVEKPTEELNEADMMLRRELKLVYLAAVVSLMIDKDPSILDRVALDIDLYGKPPGIPSGTQGAPNLRQIQDVFGAVKQDYVV